VKGFYRPPCTRMTRICTTEADVGSITSLSAFDHDVGSARIHEDLEQNPRTLGKEYGNARICGDSEKSPRTLGKEYGNARISGDSDNSPGTPGKDYENAYRFSRKMTRTLVLEIMFSVTREPEQGVEDRIRRYFIPA